MRDLRSACAAVLLLVLGLAAFGCGRESEEKDEKSAPSTPKGGPSYLKLDPAKTTDLRVEEAASVFLPLVLRAFGKIQFDEEHMALVLAPLPGQVVHLTAKVGDAVRQGEVLFQINSRDVAAAVGDYIDSRKDLELAEKTHVMTRDLFENQAAAAITLRQAENDLAKAKGKAARTEAALKTLGVDLQGESLTSLVPVRAPISGTVIDRKVTEGQYEVADSTPLLTLADLSSVWIVADLFERDLCYVKAGQKAEVATLAYPNERFTGAVSRISDVVDPVTRTVKVRIAVPNPTRRLKPEMFASVLLFREESEAAVTIPSRAAFVEGGEHYVFVRRGEGEFERRRVDILPAPEGRLRVREGLKSGEAVVSQDVMLLRAEESSGNTK